MCEWECVGCVFVCVFFCALHVGTLFPSCFNSSINFSLSQGTFMVCPHVRGYSEVCSCVCSLCGVFGFRIEAGKMFRDALDFFKTASL